MRGNLTLTAGILAIAGASGCTGAAFRDAQRAACEPHDLTGCIVDEVRVYGNTEVLASDVKEHIATAESSHVFGGALERVPILSLWDNLTVEYERFDRYVMQRELERVERYYRARGYYEAHVRAGRVTRLPNGHVAVEIVVDEGIPELLNKLDLNWTDWRADAETRGVTKAVTEIKADIALGVPFDEDVFESNKRKLLRAMTDRGFAYAKADLRANVDLPSHSVTASYTLTLGPRCTFGEIRIAGLKELSQDPIRSALAFREGDRYSTEALESAEYTLAKIGVFGAIEVRPELAAEPPSGPCKIPVQVSVSEAELKALTGGIGAEVGSRVEGHVMGGWEDHNFLGGMRHFSAEIRPGLVLWPNQINDLFRKPLELLPELRVSFQLAQPNAIIPRANAILSGAFSLYCPLINCRPIDFTDQAISDKDKEAELKEQNLIGYREFAGKLGLERGFFNERFYAAQSFNVRLYDPFSYNQRGLPPGYSNVLVPYLETNLVLDLRKGVLGKKDTVEPRRGVYLSADAQLAGGFLQGNADDFRIRPEFRGYLPVSKRATLAFRLTGGFLFPRNYGGTLVAATPPHTPDQTAERARDLQILRLRGFFSGGQNSNRGYSYNEVGPAAPADLIYPFTEQQRRERQAAIDAGRDPADIAQVPVGGLTLWESSLELRFPLSGKLGAAVFIDASDVTPDIAYLRLTHPHVSTGLGVRYDTPVGPFRLDVGYRVPYLQVVGTTTVADCKVNCPEVVVAELNPSTFLGLPIAVAIAIGEAF